MPDRGTIRVFVGLAATALAAVPAIVAARQPAIEQSCGPVTSEAAHKDIGPGPAPLAIGDSVMLIAVEPLADIGYQVNAQGCRGFQAGIRIIHRRGRTLPHLVTIALGSDSGISMADIRHSLRAIDSVPGPPRVLGLVTPREHLLGGGGKHDRRVVREAGELHPNRIKVLDWVRLSAGHPHWFQPDGLHLTSIGAEAFTRLLGRALPLATPG